MCGTSKITVLSSCDIVVTITSCAPAFLRALLGLSHHLVARSSAPLGHAALSRPMHRLAAGRGTVRKALETTSKTAGLCGSLPLPLLPPCDVILIASTRRVYHLD